MLEALLERDVAERLRPVLVRVARVRDVLAVLDAVARVVERRARRVGARVERGRGGHHLERRARRIQALRRVVVEGRRVTAGSLDVADSRDAVRLERHVGVVGRRRRHREHRSGLRVEGDGRAAAPGEVLEREPLHGRTQREDHVVAVHRLPAELAELLLERVGEVRVRARQVVVQCLLESRRRAGLGRITDHLRREVPCRVAPREDRKPVLAVPAVRREHVAPGEYLAAVDREPRDELDRVVLLVGEVADRPRLPVRRRDDERREQDERGDRDVEELLVHAAASCRFALCDMSISPATSRKLATTLDPP